METATTALKRVGLAIGVLAVLVGGAALATRLFGAPGHPEFLVLLVGELALAFAAFSPREIAGALAHALRRPQSENAARRSCHFWEAAARNAALLGALGAFVSFVALFSSTEGLADFATAVAPRVLGPWVAGLLLAVLFAVPALREAVPLSGADTTTADPVSAAGFALSNWIGYGLFGALLAAAFSPPAIRPDFRALEWLAHGPAWLVVIGGGLTLALYLGDPSRGRSVTLAFAVAGLAAALGGFLQALHGFAVANIATVASGLAFVVSACVAALVGLAAVGLPLEDRARRSENARPARIVWYVFPLATVLLLIATVAMVLTPMTRAGG